MFWRRRRTLMPNDNNQAVPPQRVDEFQTLSNCHLLRFLHAPVHQPAKRGQSYEDSQQWLEANNLGDDAKGAAGQGQ